MKSAKHAALGDIKGQVRAALASRLRGKMPAAPTPVETASDGDGGGDAGSAREEMLKRLASCRGK